MVFGKGPRPRVSVPVRVTAKSPRIATPPWKLLFDKTMELRGTNYKR